jgi:hypothetical protein
MPEQTGASISHDRTKSPRSPPSDSQTMSRDMWQLPFTVASVAQVACLLFTEHLKNR